MNTNESLTKVHAEYVQIGDLQMYCETLGNGPPLLLLHAGMATINTCFDKLRPMLGKRWATLAVEQQGHGHTADLPRPLTYEQMVDDTAALLRHKGISGADVFGWSDGGIVALGLAARHPKLVRKAAVIGAGYNTTSWSPDFKKRQASLQPDNAHTLPFRDAYRNIAPKTEDWPLLIEKLKVMWACFKGWSSAEIGSLKAPLMVMLGDGDVIRPEHALELFRMVPNGRLAILPGSDHSAPVTRVDWVTSMLLDFFDAPEEKPAASPTEKEQS